MTYTMYHVRVCVCVHIYGNVFAYYGCKCTFLCDWWSVMRVCWTTCTCKPALCRLWMLVIYIKCTQLLALSLSPFPTFQLVDKVDSYGSIQFPGWAKINVNNVIYYYGIVTLLYYCNSGQHYLTWSSLLTQSNWMFIQPLLCECMTMWHRLNCTV